MACATAATFVAPCALAQQDAPTPTPSPSRTPTVFTLPGVVPERYSLPGATPAPILVPPTIVSPSPTPTPSALTPPRVQAPRAERRSVSPKERTAGPAPAPTPAAAPEPLPAPAPVIVATPSPAAVPPPPSAATQPAMPGWLWMLFGAAATALAAGAVWFLMRRRSEAFEEFEEEFEEEVLAEATPVHVAPPPPSPPPPPRAAPPPVQRPQSDPFEILVRPVRIELGEHVVLEFELLAGNAQSIPAEGVRVSLAMISASPDQDRILAGFHRGPPVDAAGEPFDLAPGNGARMPVRLSLPRDRVHVVQVGGRPMFVAMVLVDLRWRGGLSIRRFGADFMVGAAGQGDKIGPIWLDRGPPAGPLGATRYFPREAAAA